MTSTPRDDAQSNNTVSVYPGAELTEHMIAVLRSHSPKATCGGGDECAVHEAASLLESILMWATTFPDPDPNVDNPAMIGHFAGYQKGRETVRRLLGISEDDDQQYLVAEFRSKKGAGSWG